MAIRKGRILLIALVVVFLGLILLLRMTPQVQEHSVLTIRLDRQLTEEEPESIGSIFGDPEVRTLRDMLDAIDRAQNDPNIVGIALEIYQGQGFAATEEMRNALLSFSASGKFCIAYVSEPTHTAYYLATGCPEIHLPPTSTVYLTGLMASQTFYRGFLDNLAVYPDMYSIAEYKTAKNVYTEKRFTREHREMLTDLLKGLQGQMIHAIAEARELTEAEVTRIFSTGPHLAESALDLRLVDGLSHYDEYLDHISNRSSVESPIWLSPSSYLSRTTAPTGPRIAVVYATGTITDGESGNNAFAGRILGAQTIRRAIRVADEDDSIRAIVLRVNSPGGSPLGSEIIRRQLELAQRNKPVVVSMSDYAASGGYWVSMSADRILADPGTLTGSIGVVFGKLNIEGAYNMLGFTKDHVALTPSASFLYPFENFSPQQRRKVREMMSDIYQKFIAGVAKGRNKTTEEVDSIGHGRVWLGTQALDHGLVDEIGGLNESIAAAKKLADIPADQPVTRVYLPRPRGSWELLGDFLSSSTQPVDLLRAVKELESLPLFRGSGMVLTPIQPEIH